MKTIFNFLRIRQKQLLPTDCSERIRIC